VPFVQSNPFYQGTNNYFSLPPADPSVYAELNFNGDLSTITWKSGVLKISVGLSGIIPSSRCSDLLAICTGR